MPRRPLGGPRSDLTRKRIHVPPEGEISHRGAQGAQGARGGTVGAYMFYLSRIRAKNKALAGYGRGLVVGKFVVQKICELMKNYTTS